MKHYQYISHSAFNSFTIDILVITVNASFVIHFIKFVFYEFLKLMNTSVTQTGSEYKLGRRNYRKHIEDKGEKFFNFLFSDNKQRW